MLLNYLVIKMNLIIFIYSLNLIFIYSLFIILSTFFILLQSIFFIKILQITIFASLDNNPNFIKEIIKLLLD